MWAKFQLYLNHMYLEDNGFVWLCYSLIIFSSSELTIPCVPICRLPYYVVDEQQNAGCYVQIYSIQKKVSKKCLLLKATFWKVKWIDKTEAVEHWTYISMFQTEFQIKCITF